jgi:imidazolonepropionase
LNLLLKNIRQLVTVAQNGMKYKVREGMGALGTIDDATVYIQQGIIQWVGPSNAFDLTVPDDTDTFDAAGMVAFPGFVDAHTHTVFAGSREREFALRAQGISYEEIARQGGGILNTVQATRAATKKELQKSAAKRLDAMMRHGTTTVEIKSGYGLDEETEVKILEAIHELVQKHLMTVVRHSLEPTLFHQSIVRRQTVTSIFCASACSPTLSRKTLRGLQTSFVNVVIFRSIRRGTCWNNHERLGFS